MPRYIDNAVVLCYTKDVLTIFGTERIVIMKKLVKLAATLLLVTLFVGSLPINIFAISGEEKTLTENETKNALQTVNENSVSLSSDIDALVADGNIIEDISLREENVKHFQMPDGTYKAVVYPSAVHRKDGNGQWKDINNDISLKTVKSKQRYTTSDERISFSDAFSANSELISINENGHSISMSLLPDYSKQTLSTTPISTFVTNAANNYTVKAFSNIDEATRINNTSSIKYSNIRSNTDIEYVLQGNDVKENIILRSKAEKYTYDFSLMLTGLYAELNASGEINIYDISTREVEYIIPAPYMYDSAGIISYEVSYQLVNIGEGRYILSVCANDEWINSDNRAFPVTIDPTITKSSIIFDTYISSKSPNSNYGYTSSLRVSESNTTFLKMAMPSLPDGANLTSAYWRIYYSYASTSDVTANVYKITNSWGEGTVTYNYAIENALIDTSRETTVLFRAKKSNMSAYINITNAAVEWYSDPIQNFGIAIKCDAYDTTPVYIKSYETHDDYSPHLVINYSYYIPDGIYAIKNSIYWMCIENSSTTAGAKIQKKYSSVSPLDPDFRDPAYLFKISRIPNTETYVIRSMLNHALSFNMSSDGKWVTKLISTNDSAVSLDDIFKIEWNDSGFRFEPGSSGKVVSIPSNSSADLIAVDKTSANYRAEWTLERLVLDSTSDSYIGVTYSGDIPENSILAMGDETEISITAWSALANTNNISIEAFAEPSYCANVDLDLNSRTVTIEANALGTVHCNIEICNADGAVQEELNLAYNILPPEGEYYFRNEELSEYLTKAEHTNGCIFSPLSDKDSLIWNLEHHHDGYFSLKLQSYNRYLYISPTSATYFELSLQLEEGCYWKAISTNNGENIKLVSKNFPDLCFTLQENGLSPQLSSYTDNDNYNDEWALIKIEKINLISPISQEKLNYCWIANAKMFAQNYCTEEIGLSLDQAYEKFQEINNQNNRSSTETDEPNNNSEDNSSDSGSESGLADMVKIFLNAYKEDNETAEHPIDVSQYYPIAYNNQMLSQEVLIDLLNNGDVACIGRGLIPTQRDTDSTNAAVGHFYTVTGYLSMNDTIYFWVLNSGPYNVTPGGSIELMSYNKLVYGRNALENETEDGYFWDATVICNSDNRYSTIPYYYGSQ